MSESLDPLVFEPKEAMDGMLVVKLEPEPEAESYSLEDPLRSEDVVNYAPATTTPLWEQALPSMEVNVGPKGLLSLQRSSEQRQDGRFPPGLSADTVQVDKDSRNKYMIERAIKAVLRRKAQSTALSQVTAVYNEDDGLGQLGSEAGGSELSWCEPSGSDAVPPEPVIPEPRESQSWRRANAPGTAGTRERAASSSPTPSTYPLQLENFLNDSGSDDNSGHEMCEEPGISMKEAACRLREFMVVDPEEEEVNTGGAAGGEDVDMDGAARWWAVDNEDVSPENGEYAEVPDLHTFTWSENFAEFSGREEVYTREPGPTIASADPLTIFLTIWDVTILGRIVEQTNLYAWQVISALSETDRIPRYLDAWVDTTVDEIRRLFAMFMLMALDYRARIDDYWTTGVLQMPAFRKLISRNRFQMLMRFLHFTDNYSMPSNLTSYEKKIFKVKELHDYVINKFCELYTPSRELALDETLLLWKGRLSWMQCIRSKESRFGIKSFELCESSTGYLLKSVLYAGKNSSFVEGAIHGFDSKTSKVVLKLMDGFLDVGHLVVMDNWYNQLPITRYLKHRRTDVLGTLKNNTAHVPNDVKNANPNRMQRGQQIARHCGDIAVTVWKDVKLMTVMSTCHSDEQVLGRRGGQVLMMPVSFQAYNKTMGGVDLKDTKLSSYPMERKRGRKWYMKVFLRLLNTSILNSHIIHRRNSILNSLDHRDFRLALVQSLIDWSHPVQVPRQLPVTVMTRLDGQGGHHPIHTELQGPGKREKYQRRRCKRCSARGVRAEVSIMCAKCRAPLCIGQCWIDYHTLERL